jgi:putative toxin-antitoxin system antitoxin component (TIGR02293 family)
LKKVRSILGIKARFESQFDFINVADQGVSADIIVNFKNHFDIPIQSTANMLNVSEPTIYRWTRAKKSLERNYSIKLFEVTELFVYGAEVFGNKDNFFNWLNLPNKAFGGMEPMKLIEVPEGVSKIRDLLGRIEHGVYS